MNIDISKFKLFWYELEDGTKVDELPTGYKGYAILHSAFPCKFIDEIPSCVYHPKKWYEKLLLRIRPHKQIPKKPINMIPKDKMFKGYYACPECRSAVGNENFISKYCENCGQRIDWSE